MKVTLRNLLLTLLVLAGGCGPGDSKKANRDPRSIKMPSVNGDMRPKNPRVRNGWEFKASGDKRDVSPKETRGPSPR